MQIVWDLATAGEYGLGLKQRVRQAVRRSPTVVPLTREICRPAQSLTRENSEKI
jgi:hypothetical protein